MQNKTKTIALIGLHNDKNLGDPIITESVEYLYSLYDSNYTFKRIDLEDYDKINNFLCRVIMKFDRQYNLPPSHIYKRQAYRYYKKELKEVDAVIFTGGGIIKYMGQYFYGLGAALRVASEYKIPVAINSVGVEGYDGGDKKCVSLVKSLKYNSLKYISTRDDIETLRKYYIDKKVISEKVADPAVWIAERYTITKNENSNTIGVGVGDFSLFTRYKTTVSQKQIEDFYTSMIVELLASNIDVKLFTNGVSHDNLAAKQIQEDVMMRTGKQIEIMIPSTCKQLVWILSEFKAVVATRMHSCIVAYSLNIPAIGLVWNNKLSLFGKNIGAPDYYLCDDEIDPYVAINRLEKAIEKGYDLNIRNKFRNTIKNGIKNIAEIFHE